MEAKTATENQSKIDQVKKTLSNWCQSQKVVLTEFKVQSRTFYCQFEARVPGTGELSFYINAPFKWYFGTIELRPEPKRIVFNCHLNFTESDLFIEYENDPKLKKW